MDCKLRIVAVEALKTDVFVIFASKLSIVPVIDWKVSIEPTMASISRTVTMEALKMETFAIDD